MPRRGRVCFEAAGITDPGLARESNEDSFVVRPDLGLLAVADGVSCSGAGALAAALAVREVERCFEEARRRGASSRLTPDLARGRLVRAFACAHRRVLEAGRRHPQHEGMSTTLAAIVVVRDRVVVGHLGDSRVYRLRRRYLDRRPRSPVWGGEVVIDRLTLDHNGAEDPDWQDEDRDLASPARLHLLTRGIGFDWPSRVTTRIEKVEPEDTFLLCTDGLHGVLTDTLVELPLRYIGGLRKAMGPEQQGLALPDLQATWFVKRVKQFKAPDNVTVVVARFKKGRGRWRTEREIGHVVHASPYREAWVAADPARGDEDER